MSEVPTPDFEKRFCKTLERFDLDVSGLSVNFLEGKLMAGSMGRMERLRRMVSITNELFAEAVRYVSENFSKGTEIHNIMEFIQKSASISVENNENGLLYRNPSVNILIGENIRRSIVRYSQNFDITLKEMENTDRYEISNGISTTKKVNIQGLDSDTVSFVHGEGKSDFGNETLALEFLFIPIAFIDRVGENPLEAIADIVEAGSHMRDCVLGRYGRYSKYRAGMYRAMFLSSFAIGNDWYKLSERSSELIDNYGYLLYRQDWSNLIFYQHDVNSVFTN